MARKYITSESVTEGHPDKICDQVSDAILDDLLRQDPNSHVAVETMTTTGVVICAGEVTTRGFTDVQKIARNTLKEIGYTDPEYGIDSQDAAVLVSIHEQSPDIAMGVNEKSGKEQGAGDQGMMYGYAATETPELMPLPIMLAHRLTQKLAEVRKNGTLPYLGPDGKSQVSIEYGEGKPLRASDIVIAAQHREATSEETVRKDIIGHVITPACGKWLDADTKIHINATGKFVIGGPQGDTGVTGRKIMVDTYGGVARHGGGCFCLAGSSYVNTEKGLVEIEKCSQIGEKGLLVKTDVHPMHAGEWYDNGIRETVKIETGDGFSLEGTPNHRIRVMDESGNYVWRMLGEIKPSDYIAVQTKNRLFGNDEIPKFGFRYREGTAEKRKNRFVYPEKITPDYAYLLGLLVGDGDCTDEGCIKVCICEKEQTENVLGLFGKLFGDKPKIFGHWAYVGGVELRAYLKHLGLGFERSFDKRVPKAIFGASKKTTAAFLSGLFDTDGSVRNEGRNKNTAKVHLTTTSRTLAEEVQLLLLNFGIISKIYAVDARGSKSYINGRKIVSKRVRYHVVLKGSGSRRVFASEIGFRLPRKQNILLRLVSKAKRDLLRVPNQTERIKRLFGKLQPGERQKDACHIGRFTRSRAGKATKELTYEKLGEFLKSYENQLHGDPDFECLKMLYFMRHHYTTLSKAIPSFAHTYDLNIPQLHTFTANGFVCHNSGKDPSKVDRSGAYAMRWVAKNIVAAGLAEKCEVAVSYCIGIAEPTSIDVETFGTGKIPEEEIAEMVKKNFRLTPRWIIETLKLKRPIYKKTAAYGHFGRNDPDFTWEKTDMVELLKREAGI